MPIMKALVTGATGLVGSHLVEKLVERGDKIRALVRPTSDTDWLAALGIELVHGDLEDLDSLRSTCKEIDIVYHCAARLPLGGSRKQFYRANLEGVKNLLRACQETGVQRFVYTSTVDVYGYGHQRGSDEGTPYKPDGYYSETKIAAERLIWQAHQEAGLPVTIIRPCLIYGPHDRNLWPTLARMLTQARVPLIGGGRTLTDLVYAGDVAQALILAGTRAEAAGQAYNVTDGARRTVRELFTTLAQTLKVNPRFVSVPYALAYGAARLISAGARAFGWIPPSNLQPDIIKALGHDRHFDISKIRDQLGYRSEVDLEAGLQQTLAWYQRVAR
jgi:nucleoside-diphosphate-sugar epimerase